MYKCKNCSWEGDTLSKTPLIGKCPVCGDEVIGKGSEPKETKLNLDLNNDGVVDKKDRSLAAKVLGTGRKKKRRK